MNCAAILAFCAGAIPGPSASAATTFERDTIGQFTIEREHSVNDGTPIMHVANEYKRNRLIWTSLDGKVRFYFEDDGRELSSRATIQTGEKETCLSFGQPFPYPAADDPSRPWRRALRKQFDDFLRGCTSLARDRRSAYLAEFDATDSDLVPALASFKRAATADFNGWMRRCVQFKQSKMVMAHGGPPLRDCVRYSADRN